MRQSCRLNHAAGEEAFRINRKFSGCQGKIGQQSNALARARAALAGRYAATLPP